MTLVNKDATPELNGNVTEDEDCLEENVDPHLLSEHVLGKLIRISALPPVQRVNQIRSILSKGAFKDGTLAKEVVLLALHDAVKDEVDDEEHRCPVHAWRVDFIWAAEWAESWDEGKQEGQSVQDVHDLEVAVCFLFNCVTGRASQIVEDFLEADEVEQVCQVYHKEEARNVLLRRLQYDQCRQNHNEGEEYDRNHSAAWVLLEVHVHGISEHEHDHGNLAEDKDYPNQSKNETYS